MKTHHSFEHGNVSEALPSILAHVMMDGEEVGTRQGERAKEILIPRIALWKPWEREVLVPGRKASLPAQIAETMWVLAGRNDVEWLSHYLPRAGDFSDDGTTWTGGYGPRIRGWKGGASVGIDQLAHVIDLLNNERGTRRAVINIYDPEIDWSGGKDVPCNNWLSFISRNGKLHMNVATRSNDVIWGWSGINQFEWSVLQEIVAHLTGNQIGTLTFNVTSLHVYEKHWDKALKIVDKDPVWAPDLSKPSPRFDLDNRSLGRLDDLIQSWFMIEAMIRSGDPAEFHVDGFPEPMMQSWLRVIQWYWCRNDNYLDPINGTRLWTAAMMSPKRKPTAAEQAVLNNPHVSQAIKETFEGAPPSLMSIMPTLREDTRDKVTPLAWTSQFVEFVDNLHREKSAVYGDSWKRRGEILAILANIARKVDRLGEGGAGDTAADTVIDLLVYLIKYRLWLNALLPHESKNRWAPETEDDAVRAVLNVEDQRCVKVVQHASVPPRIVALKEFFEQLRLVAEDDAEFTNLQARIQIVDHMITLAFPTARYFWGVENGHLLNPYESELLFTAPLGEVGAKVQSRLESNAARRWEGYESEGENID